MWLLLAAACAPPPLSSSETGVGVPPMAAIDGQATVRTCPAPTRRTAPAFVPSPDPDEVAQIVDFALAPRPGPGLLDLTLLIDRSGSMDEEGRMHQVKAGIRTIGARLTPGDRLALVLFDSEPCVPLEDWVAGRDDPGVLADTIAAISPRASTNLPLGLHEAYRVATRMPGFGDDRRLGRVLLLTDALLDEGDVPEATTTEVRRAWTLYHLRLSAVAIGRGADGPLLQQLAAMGQGRYGSLGRTD